MNDFKEYIQNLANRALPNTSQEQEAIKNYGDSRLEKYRKFRDNPYVRNYFNHVVAAIMISQYENYEQSGINIPYRYKARKSTIDKVNKRLNKARVHYSENGDIVIDDVDPLLDIFAMEVVSRRRPTIMTSNNPEIQGLLDEQEDYQKALRDFQAFRSTLLIDDLKPAKPGNFKFDCTQIEYYTKTKEILEKLKEIVHPTATVLINHYDEQIALIKQRLDFLKSSPDENVTVEDFQDKSVNFFTLVTEFETRLHNKAELAILTKQITSLFEDNPLFERLGISLADIPVEEKRNERGFESNFLYIDTPLGRIECQLQTEGQFRFGNYGFAAHTKLSGKKIEIVKIPEDEELKQEIQEFRQRIRFISPNAYLARMDDNENGRVMTIEFGDYQDYRKIISQIADGDPSERFLKNYSSRLYASRHFLFDREDRSFCFIKTDIEDYTESDEFKHLLEIAPTLNKDNFTHESDVPTNPDLHENESR